VLLIAQDDLTWNGPAVPLELALTDVGEPKLALSVSFRRQNDPALTASAVTVNR